ncbi:hypothetical protein JCM8097_005226 [Rhodosporidiobolus ruineniae]
MPLTAAVAPRSSTLLALALAALLFLQLLVPGVSAQETTLTQEDNGAIITTSIAPTVYTTNDVVMTWTPTPPSTTLVPTLSSGSVMNIKDYISTISGSGAGAATAAGAVGQQKFKVNAATSGAAAAAGRSSLSAGWAAVGAVLLGGVVGVMAV